MRSIIYTIIALASTSGLVAQFSKVELTKDDVISIYEVSVDKKPAKKFAWKFDAPRYVRFVVEESDSKGEKWRLRGSYPYHLPVTQASLIYWIEKMPNGGPEGNFSAVFLRIGDELGSQYGWNGSSFLIPAGPPATVQEVLDSGNPEKLHLLKYRDTAIRFRLEASEKPY